LVLIGLFLGAPVARAGDSSVIADFDGDGRHDRVEVDHGKASLHVWLSTTCTTSVVRSSTPIVGVAARDLDGDRRAELIASGTSTRVQVWTKRHGEFAPFRPGPAVPRTLAATPRHSVEDGDSDVPAAVASATPTLFALAPTPGTRVPGPIATPFCAGVEIDSCPSLALTTLGPRPPPLS